MQISEGDRYFVVTQHTWGYWNFWGYRTLSEARKNVDALDIGMWKIKREV
jgi:hypothetical protein